MAALRQPDAIENNQCDATTPRMSELRMARLKHRFSCVIGEFEQGMRVLIHSRGHFCCRSCLRRTHFGSVFHFGCRARPSVPCGPRRPARRWLRRRCRRWRSTSGGSVCRAQAPTSQPTTAAQGSMRAIWISFSACTTASTPLDIFERELEFWNGRLNGILRGYTR